MKTLDFAERWGQSRLSSLFIENTTKNTPFAEENALQFFFGSIIPKKKYELTEDLIETYEKYTVVFPNDIMINGLNLNYDFVSQRIALVKEKGIITSAYIALRLRNQTKVNARYYCYLFKAMDAQKVFHGMGTGIRLTLSFKELKSVMLPVPPRPEQDQIVRFLDWKVSTVNRLISIKKKLIQDYEEAKKKIVVSLVIKGLDDSVPMKDSGSKWLGTIPANWRCLRAKYLFREVDDRSLIGKEELLTVSHISGITPRSAKNVTMFKSESLIGYKICKPGRIAANTMWMWQGAIAVSNYDGVISPSYNTYEQISDGYIPEYLDFLLRAKPLVDNYVVLSSGIRKSRLRLYPEQFLTILFPVPPIEDQRRIVDAIRERVAKIQDIISVRQQEISALQEFKARLIADVVTGKIDVRGIQIPEYEFAEENIDTENDESMEGMESETYEE